MRRGGESAARTISGSSGGGARSRRRSRPARTAARRSRSWWSAGSASGRAIGAVVVELDHPRDRHQRRVEAAGARGDDDVAAPERVAADLERAHVDRAVAAALAITGMPLRSSRAGTMLARSETSRTRDASAPASMIRPTSPSAERTGMPICDPVARAGRRIAKRRGLLNEEPTMRPVGDRRRWRAREAGASALSCRFSCKIALASTIRWSIALRSRLSSPFWRAASQ